MTLLEILKDIRRVHVELQDDQAQCRNNGICHNVYVRCGGTRRNPEDFQYDLYEVWAKKSRHWYLSWPLYSGEAAYPVPGVRAELASYAQERWDAGDDLPLGRAAARAGLAYDYCKDKWKGVTGYQRAQLLDHLIRCAEAEGL